MTLTLWTEVDGWTMSEMDWSAELEEQRRQVREGSAVDAFLAEHSPAGADDRLVFVLRTSLFLLLFSEPSADGSCDWSRAKRSARARKLRRRRAASSSPQNPWERNETHHFDLCFPWYALKASPPYLALPPSSRMRRPRSSTFFPLLETLRPVS